MEKINMRKWLNDLLDTEEKKAMPILSFPAVQLLNVSVRELISDSELQAKGMKAVADRTDMLAALSYMDLSVEAEAFGSNAVFSEDEVPTITGKIVTTMEDAENLKVPQVGNGRTGIYIEGVAKAAELITDRPILAGCIGPFSLAGRLMDVTEAMVNCYIEPEMVHKTLQKATDFLIQYITAYKNAGANGVMMAEPLAGILSPDLVDDFSSKYVKQIADAVQDDEFILIYHNCGNNVMHLMDSILGCGASAFHFGNAVSMAEIMEKVPADVIAMGNVDPAAQFRNGTPESVHKATMEILEACGSYPNFIISSGCDIPPVTSWDNIDAFFEAAKGYYFEPYTELPGKERSGAA